MSQRYIGGLETLNPTPLNPTLGNAANGVFTMSQYLSLKAQNLWPGFDPYFNYTTLLLHGNGTNGAQNNTFLDSGTANSGSGFTITRNGDTTQGTFSPFSLSAGTWSNYFDGTANGSLSTDSSADTNLSGDFTIQAWVYPTASAQSSNSEIISRGAATTFNGWHFGLFGSTTQPFFGVNYAGTGATVYIQSSTNISLNQWTHLAVTRSGNTVIIYINGVANTTNTGFTGTPTVSGTEYVYVGRASYDTSNRQFTGYISNASIIKGTALTSFSTTAPLATGTSGQSLLTCTTNRFIDSNTATTAKTLTAGSGASVQAFSPFLPTAAYSAATVGGSGYFDGSGDYLSVPDNATFNFGSNDFTIEMWVYPTAVGQASLTLLYAKPNGSGYSGVIVGQAVSGYGAVLYASSTGTSWDLANGASIGTMIPSAWNHIVVSRSGTNIRGFLNGVVGSTTAVSTTALVSTTGTVSIGSSNGTASTFATGYITDVRVLNGTGYTTITVPTAPLTAITNTSLLLNFTNAGIIDNTAKNDLRTVGNAQISTSVSKFGGGSMAFDGSGDFVQTFISNPDLRFGTGNFTVEGWVYFNTSGQHGILQISTNPGGFNASNTNSIAIQRSATGQWEIYAKNSNPQASATINQNQWYHFAVVRSGTTTTFYVNGSSTITVTSDSTNYTGSFIGLGAIYSTAVPLNGYIDDLRITKGYARYTSNFTPQTSQWQDQ